MKHNIVGEHCVVCGLNFPFGINLFELDADCAGFKLPIPTLNTLKHVKKMEGTEMVKICFSCGKEIKEGQTYTIGTVGTHNTFTHVECPSNSQIKEKETVVRPDHYNAGKIECIDALEAATVNLTGIEAFCTANAIKYLWRWKQKNGIEDLRKAEYYIGWLIRHIE